MSPLLHDPDISGTAYVLTAFTSDSITVVNNQHPDPIELPYDTDTKFRRAQLNLYDDGACKDIATQYNDPLNSDSLTVILSGYAGARCHVRVVTVAEPPTHICHRTRFGR